MTEQRAAQSVVESDVIVVGAGPGGSTAAKWLADRGLQVTLLEKATFPRDKVCGDGLTPRATKQLLRLGIDVSEEAGWLHNKGLVLSLGVNPQLGKADPYAMAVSAVERRMPCSMPCQVPPSIASSIGARASR